MGKKTILCKYFPYTFRDNNLDGTLQQSKRAMLGQRLFSNPSLVQVD